MSSIARPDKSIAAPSLTDSPPKPASAAGGRFRGWIRNSLPTAAVVAALAAIAYWGHSWEWTIPRFSTLIGGAGVKTEDWCAEHGVPESQCIECNKSLVPPLEDHGWCAVHGVSQCTLHHPEVAQLKSIPTITSEDMARAERALALRPRMENSSHCNLHEHRIQFASIAAVERSGVDIAIASEQPIIETIPANGEVVYDQTQMAHLASRVPGTVWRVEKRIGDRVAAGELLALVDSAEVGKAKAELLQAIAQVRLKLPTLERLKPLAADDLVSKRLLRDAEAALQEAKIRLHSAQQTLVNLGLSVRAQDYDSMDVDEIAARVHHLGVPAELASNLDVATTSSNLFPLRAPLDGVVVSCTIVPGEVVDTSSVLMVIANTKLMWLMLDVPLSDAKYLELGQTVLFRPGHDRSEAEIRGAIGWISTEADDETRTVKVRVNLPNPDGKLRANTFGSGRIVLREEPRAIVVPNEAVHREKDCSVVFVRDKDFFKEGHPKFFHVRKVRVGVRNEDGTEIIVGLLPGEVIASKNSVVLQSQLLKSNLGAGCCEVCPPTK